MMVTVLLLVFDEASAITCPRWVKLNKSPVCFGARGNQYGRFSYNQKIFVTSSLLPHRSGTVSCAKSSKGAYSYWGCTPNHADISVILTDRQNRILAPAASAVNSKTGWYRLAGYTSSQAIAFLIKHSYSCKNAYVSSY